MKIIFFFIIFFYYPKLFGQHNNLIPNESFENYIKCPFENNEENLKGSLKKWYLPTFGTSDYFNICSSSKELSVPNNFFGYQKPYNGNGYVGIYTYNSLKNNKNYREYLSIKLKDTLVQNKIYKFKMYISLADNSTSGCNNLGIYLHSDSLHGRIIKGNIIEMPQTESNIKVLGNVDYSNVVENKEVITDIINWVLIELEYKAKGNERFLTIGNFRIDRKTKCKKVKNLKRTKEIDTFYYIDNVSLVEKSSNI